MINRFIKALVPEYSGDQITNSSYVFSSKFFLNFIWLLGCTYLVFFLGIEKNKGFDKVAFILTGAFSIYIFIPLKLRKLFLVLLAFGIESYLFGIKLSIGVLLFIIFFVALTYIKRKPLSYVLVIISTVLCVLITSKVVVIPVMRVVIMLGALFIMLRYIYLLYELNYMKVQPVFIDRLCYLFLIPNACFPLFPVLSPVEYQNSFYAVPSERSFAKGLNWISIGIIHLLIYRTIYLYFSPSPYEINSFGMWVWYVLSAYSLIMRLSGLFYLAMGFLQLFGFVVPPIFDHVYFASGFPDLWRRVNLYWRSFMMRVFYYPLVFKFKKSDQAFVMFFATLTMFVCTWFLHSWQWYWIKGSYFFNLTDVLFWLMLGLIISLSAVNSYRQLSGKSAAAQRSGNYYLKAARVVLMFFTMSFLWSLWTASSVTEFLYISKFSVQGSAVSYLLLLCCTALVVIVAGAIRRSYYKYNWFGFVFKEIKPAVGIGMCLLIILTSEVLKRSDHSGALENFIGMNINNRDKALLERGYYEQVLNNDDKSIELVNLGAKYKKWNLDRDAYRKTNNELIKEFIPNYSTTFKGDSLVTNSFGLRDKEYALEKADSTVRIAFVGGSYVMGSGVSNEKNFAALIEEKLRTQSRRSVEVWNFGVGGYYLIQSVFVTVNKLPKYKPDLLFYFVHSDYRHRCLDNFATLLQKQTPLTFTYLSDVVEKAGVKKGMCHLEIYNRLRPFSDALLQWGFSTIFESCKAANIQPVMVYLPSNAGIKKDADKIACMQEAQRSGFHVIDLSDVYTGYDPNEIQLAAWDTHPNEKGHQLISEKLLKEIKKDNSFFNFIK